MQAMEINIKLVESKVNLYGREDKSAWEYLTNEEREIYAQHLAGRKHFLSASRFTINTEKTAEFLRLHNEKFGLT
jgi:hypothetical protein